MIVAGGKGTGIVRSVIEIDGIHEDEQAPESGRGRYLTGRVLPEGHPVRDAYWDKPDPSDSRSQNSIAYTPEPLPEEREYLIQPCRCRCGTHVRNAFAPGHDQRAIHDRINRHFGGSVVEFLDWFDAHAPRGQDAV
ncbi:MAG: hypothetical protein M3R38_38650 [Actinomycetota bacterium]|nr:hypothetical protein [Actinomycetota bacterium]